MYKTHNGDRYILSNVSIVVYMLCGTQWRVMPDSLAISVRAHFSATKGA